MPQLARWLTYIEQFDYEVVHHPGTKHGNADALSQTPALVKVDEQNFQEDTEPRIHKVKSAPIPVGGSLSERQQMDPELGAFIRLRKTREMPPESEEVQAESELTKKLVSRWYQFEVHDDLVYRRHKNTPRGKDDYLQLVVPRTNIHEVIEQCHGGCTGGHACEKKTTDQVQRRFYWDNWQINTRNFCLHCTTCARYHRGKPPRQGLLRPVLAGAPCERWYIDLTGPHPKSSLGNIYILTRFDSFTKWAEAFPLKTKEADCPNPGREGLLSIRHAFVHPQ